MTGTFIAAIRSGPCVISSCKTVIQVGTWVYLFRGLANQTVCPGCALSRWGYQPPSDLPPELPARSCIYVAEGRTVEPNFESFDRQAAGSELRKNILTRRQLQEANASDPKLKQLGGDR